jgi:hypothetical protein
MSGRVAVAILSVAACACLALTPSASASDPPYLDAGYSTGLASWLDSPPALAATALAARLGSVELASGSAVGIADLGVSTLPIAVGTAATLGYGALVTY